MKTKLFLVLLCVCLVAGCAPAFGQKLYPVQGPLATQTPVPVFSAKVKNPMFSIGSLKTSSGSITWLLANGEKLQGKLAVPLVKASSANTKTLGAPDSYPPQPNLAFAWDAIYGQGYYVAHVLGKSIWQEAFTGDQGTVLQVESMNNYSGVAVDNKGNIYKVVF
jgi:hypothetical protein